MPYSRNERIGMFLQRFKILHPLILEHSHWYDGKRVCVNKISGHLVVVR